MQNRKLFKIQQLPSDVKANVFTFFGVKAVPLLSIVCKEWQHAVKSESLKEMICNDVVISPDQLSTNADELKEAYIELCSYEAKHQHADYLLKEIKEDEPEIELMHRNLSTAIRQGIVYPPVLMTRKVQKTGLAVGLGSGGMAALISSLACPNMLAIFSVVSCLGGCGLSTLVKSYLEEKRYTELKEERASLSIQLSAMQLPLLKRVKKEKIETEMTPDAQDDSLYFRLL